MHDETPMTTPDTPAGAQDARDPIDYADYLTIKAIWETERAELERIIYDCVSLSDIMRNGHSEATYRRIVAKYDTPAPRAADADAHRSGGE